MPWIRPALCLALLVGLPLGCSAACHSMSASYMVGYVPEKFGLTQTYSEGACINDILAYTGAFAVGLDSQTVQDIQEVGIHYFDDIGGPRVNDRKVRFSDWKETPAPAGAFSPEPANNFYCGEKYGWFWSSGFTDALQTSGSYYSDGLGGRSAVVIPSLGIIAISMSTR